VLTSPADISWGRDDVLVQPDVFVVVTLDEARTGDWSRLRSLLLLIEVLSPSTTRADRFTKRRRYQEAGVPLYWVVDGTEEHVEVWTPDVRVPGDRAGATGVALAGRRSAVQARAGLAVSAGVILGTNAPASRAAIEVRPKMFGERAAGHCGGHPETATGVGPSLVEPSPSWPLKL